MAVTVTRTRTYSVRVFADPYKKCDECGEWIDGTLEKDGPIVVSPCLHESNYRDVCASWGPVDGCTCPPSWHEHRRPAPDDRRTY